MFNVLLLVSDRNFFTIMHHKATSLSHYGHDDALTFFEPLVRSQEPL